MGLGPGHIVLDGHPPSQPPNFQPMCIVANGWMDQDATWYGDRPWPKQHCVAWGPSSPPSKRVQPPIFGLYLLWPNSCMYQDTTWYRGRPRRHCIRWGPSSLSLNGHSPQFLANVHCDQTAGWTKMPLGMEVDLGPDDFVFDWEPLPTRKRHSPTQFCPMSIVAKRLDGSSCHLVQR